MKSKVAVAMSGGVDSSVAAAWLQNQGYEVIGVTMEHLDASLLPAQGALRHPYQPSRDAAIVCRQLGIEHHVVDLHALFEQTVIDYFVGEYLAGRTPNPCVHCNVHIKWGALWEFGRRCGAGLFATGHYCRVQSDPQTGRYWLQQAVHRPKDQSYALWRLSQEQLRCTLFPLGAWSKEEVRAKAREWNLSVAHKNESQEICFVLDDDFRRFLTDRLTQAGHSIPSGDFVDRTGAVIGRHRGYPFYTIGQRKGLGVALGRPVFVCEIDPGRNRIRLGEQQELLASGLIADQSNWLAWPQPAAGTKVEARIRYKDPGFAATIDQVETDRFILRFDEPRPAVTPGQSVVCYQEDRLVGGGIIEQALP
ncbi:MAG TPA: tRNA 2-thiouridine(34) synthase MnmA [bacterium]|nr:tRNA 2-thiouridine(34) synthase MnmA [bacterium]HPN33710.1 tRNA 2-thiouridine(34) synthase MnmA [bacterium]